MRKLSWVLLLSLAMGCGYKRELESMVEDQREMIVARDATISEQNASIVQLEADLAYAETQLADARDRATRILADAGAMAADIESMKVAIEELEMRRRLAEERIAEYRDFLVRFKTLIDAGTLEVKIVDGRMVVAMATDVLFASGSAQLSPDGKKALSEVGAVLKDFPEKDFQIEGHTDDVPISSSQYPTNWYLASGRAIGVVEHLLSSGMSPTQVSAASYGEFRPVAANTSPQGKAANRRIEIVVMPDLSLLPGYDELTGIATTDVE